MTTLDPLLTKSTDSKEIQNLTASQNQSFKPAPPGPFTIDPGTIQLAKSPFSLT
jgi:hypothetical protein